VSGHQYALPGMGSYIGVAIAQGSLAKVGIAVGVMVLLVVGVNAVFFRPSSLGLRSSGWKNPRQPTSREASFSISFVGPTFVNT
jgi:hypothetical protein